MNRIWVLATAFLLVFTLSLHADGQEKSSSENNKSKQDDRGHFVGGQSPKLLKIFRLKQLDPRQAKKVVFEMLPDIHEVQGGTLRIAEDERTKSLIAYGTQKDLSQVESLLEMLDVPMSILPNWETDAGKSLSSNVPPSYAAALLKKWVLKEGTIRRQETGNELIVDAPHTEMGRVDDFLADLELQSSRPISIDLQMRLVWLVDRSLMEKDAPQVPDDLSEPIAKLAKKVGIGELRTAAQILVNVNRVEAEFTASGTAMLDHEYSLEIGGRQEMRTLKEHAVNLTISARRQGSDKAFINQQTEIITSPGRPVVLGMSPIGSKTSVFVVEILENSTDGAEGQPDSKQGSSNTGR